MKNKVAPARNSIPPPLAGGGRGSARASEHAGEGQREALEVREGAVSRYFVKAQQAGQTSGRVNPQASIWPIKRLHDVARTASGGTPKRDRPEFYGGPILWIKSGELRDGVVREAEESITQLGLDSSSAKIFPKGTLCVALYGATVGRLGILDIEAATNQAVCGVFPSKEVDTKYLFYFLFSKRSALIRDAKGGAQPNISQQIIRDLEVPLPPLIEQRRIVAELETQLTRLDASVTALKRVQTNLKRYRASVLKAACEGRLVPTEAELARVEGRSYESATELLERALVDRRALHGRGKYQQPGSADSGVLPPIPESWIWATFEQLSVRVTVGFVGPMKHEYVASGAIPPVAEHSRESLRSKWHVVYQARIPRQAIKVGYSPWRSGSGEVRLSRRYLRDPRHSDGGQLR